ncbi:MAG: flagellar brake protein [Herminiimonas sp.]|nr:flagellar brake protein [Herminiimonas sp.]
MQTTTVDESSQEDLSPFQVSSRREIVGLLRSLGDSNQLIRMVVNNGTEAIVTSVLAVDDMSGIVVIDCAASSVRNALIAESGNISFETVHDNIRILFFADQVEECIYEDRPAFTMAIPASMIRLQRREYYRVSTPVANPVRCTIHIPHTKDEVATTVSVALQNVSGGGLAIVDDKGQLDPTVGRIYNDCRIDLPGGTLVVAALQIRNMQDIKKNNGKIVRRLGCLFVELPKPMMAAIQRYITKLEREQNARSAGSR